MSRITPQELEAVARAIYVADGATHGGWAEKSEDGREYWRGLARAALEAAAEARPESDGDVVELFRHTTWDGADWFSLPFEPRAAEYVQFSGEYESASFARATAAEARPEGDPLIRGTHRAALKVQAAVLFAIEQGCDPEYIRSTVEAELPPAASPSVGDAELRQWNEDRNLPENIDPNADAHQQQWAFGYWFAVDELRKKLDSAPVGDGERIERSIDAIDSDTNTRFKVTTELTEAEIEALRREVDAYAVVRLNTTDALVFLHHLQQRGLTVRAQEGGNR